MNFKRYLVEAEWLKGKRRFTSEALWEILHPLASSRIHLLAASNNRVLPIREGNYIAATGVIPFMRMGVPALFYEADKVILHILRVNPRHLWTIDPSHNQKNPWLLMKTHWEDLQGEYNKLLKKQVLTFIS